MTMRKLLLALTLTLVGCGQSDLSTELGSNPAPLPLSQSARLVSEGRTINVPVGSLTRTTTLSLAPPQLLPPLKHAQVLGSPVRLNLGVSETSGPIQITFPEIKTSNQEVLAVIEGSDQYFPLERNGSTAILDLATAQIPDLPAPDQDGRDIHFVLVEPETSSSYRVWNTYNGYVFEKDNAGQVVRRPLILRGIPTGPLPNLGSRPVMLVHGLGDTIHEDDRWTQIARRLLDTGVASGVVAFEYDTQDSAAHNGAFLRQYYSLLGAQKQWRHLAHSMGCVVSRSCFETGNLPISPAGNKAFFLCGPHLGSPAIQVLQGRLGIAQRVFRYLVLNGIMTFENADGTWCDVDSRRPGFSDLRTDSPLLAQLNAGASGTHPQVDYATLGGNSRGATYWFLDFVMGVWLDDGLVDLPSANFTGMGALQFNTVGVNHSEATTKAISLDRAGNFLLP